MNRTMFTKLTYDQTANWRDPDARTAQDAQRLIRRDITEEARSKGYMAVELADDEGIVLERWEVVT